MERQLELEGELPPIRIAAIGDLHIRGEIPAGLTDELLKLGERADVLVVAGDITDGGRIPEIELAADLFRAVTLPIVTVLGNHDRRCLRRTAFRRILESAGAILLDAEATTLELGCRVGFAGIGGYGGGFWPDEGPFPLHSRVSQALALRARREAIRLDTALAQLETDLTIVVMHYAPTASTLGNEPPLKYWMLGNSQLGRVVDRYPVDLVIHGHAHLGNPTGQTLGGIPVWNVATSVTSGPVIHEVAPRRESRGVHHHAGVAR
ncbi:MAG: metallophosphoesterase [Chloroflexota bacterium]|nr:metallophosphoesterase [Chloroflexota bacterium]